MSALLNLCWTHGMESRSRDEYASVWGRIKKTVNWRFSISSEETNVMRERRENSREREAAPFGAQPDFPRKPLRKGLTKSLGRRSPVCLFYVKGERSQQKLQAWERKWKVVLSAGIENPGRENIIRWEVRVIGLVTGDSTSPLKPMLWH